jgi:hypothetical protein
MKSKPSDTPRKSFVANARGSVAIIMGFSTIPLMLAADFAVTQTVKARLDAAADAAALAAIKIAQATIMDSRLRLSALNGMEMRRREKLGLVDSAK